nr:MAG TPA: Baseplate J like protein [Herelleviridae sp.]
MKTRKLTHILSKMIDKIMVSTSKINDFTPGSAVRSLLEAVSLEIEQFYILTKENIEWGIEEGIIEAFDFDKRKERRAYGDVTITFYNPLDQTMYIPKGTTFTSTRQQYSQQFETLVDYYVNPGSTEAIIEVFAKDVGIIGNVPEDTINVMVSSSTLVKSVTNESSFYTGQERESQEDFKRRFHTYVESRGRATNKSLRYGALQVPDITGVHVYEEVGLVTIYAHDNNGNLSDTLKKDIEKSVEDYRPSGIMLKIEPVVKTEVDVDVTVTISNKARIGETLQRHIENVIRAYLNEFEVADDLIIADLTQIIMNIDDALIYDISIDSIQGNVETVPEEIIRAGKINVTLV